MRYPLLRNVIELRRALKLMRRTLIAPEFRPLSVVLPGACLLQGQCNGHEAVGAIESGRGGAQSPPICFLPGWRPARRAGSSGTRRRSASGCVASAVFEPFAASGQSAGRPVN